MIKLFKKKENKNLLDITYNESSGIPFKWEYEIEDNTICEFAKTISKVEKTKEPICGGKVDTHFLFKGLKQGTTKIIFKYVNFADNYLSEINTYTIEVKEDLKPIIINKEEKRVR